MAIGAPSANMIATVKPMAAIALAKPKLSVMPAPIASHARKAQALIAVPATRPALHRRAEIAV
jgi:hypothetical protein